MVAVQGKTRPPHTQAEMPSLVAKSALRAALRSRCAVTGSRFLATHQNPASEQQQSVREDYQESTKIPDFSKYRTKQSVDGSRSFSYFMSGTLGLIAAAGAQATVSDFLANMSASADVLALAKVELDLAKIPEGKNVIIKWRGKPVFIRHRTADEIEEANNIDVSSLRDPQKDEERVKKPEWLVMLGVCTHLGCVPIGEAGEYGGWFCPCHGSHYDICTSISMSCCAG
ncbi:hypothetical protein G7K_3655-t1 [Saitoella complicata NRRL Y-17804]|uniref:Cytochrome b-c1 complex subunit Rieske, mitochondrial n=1 Tax=Saitoella complicata (strain BCRC 22490 / CBS 7301 / JCM 7358 / NBRC 10748 / NRRL Y-17804) TaxID=698492 RepID=A0A0E9NIK6_SAICN|nr:hypothetical protein G7K_3655-t1 [Saitoella complicata NRRL Y-17804]